MRVKIGTDDGWRLRKKILERVLLMMNRGHRGIETNIKEGRREGRERKKRSCKALFLSVLEKRREELNEFSHSIINLWHKIC